MNLESWIDEFLVVMYLGGSPFLYQYDENVRSRLIETHITEIPLMIESKKALLSKFKEVGSDRYEQGYSTGSIDAIIARDKAASQIKEIIAKVDERKSKPSLIEDQNKLKSKED